MNLIGEALLRLDPLICSLFIYNCNPALVAPEANKVRKGLAREDLFTVVHDLFLTETAMYADLVLPACSSYEVLDIFTSYWHHYIQIQEPVIAPYGESKSNTEVFRLLARAFGFKEDSLYDHDEELISQALNEPKNDGLNGINLQVLLEKKYVKATRKSILADRLVTPSGKIELYSERMKEDGYPPLPTYIEITKDNEHPFVFIPAPNHNFLNSTFSNNEKHVALEKIPRIHINEKDARVLEITDGELVKVWNERGYCELTAAVSDSVLPGVAVSQGIWADLPDEKRNVNALAPDRIADMGGGATFFSGRVSIEKCSR